MLAILGLAMLGAVVFSLYGVHNTLACQGFSMAANQVGRNTMLTSSLPQYTDNAQNFSCALKHGWKWSLGGRGFKGFEVETSEGFKEKVLSIAMKDEDVQKLLNEGYSVNNIKIMQVRFVAQENGQITMEARKALVVLVNGNGGRACVEVDLKAEKVTRIVIVNIKVIEKSTLT